MPRYTSKDGSRHIETSIPSEGVELRAQGFTVSEALTEAVREADAERGGAPASRDVSETDTDPGAPAQSATRPEWETYATAQGMNPDEVAAFKNKQELIAAVEGDPGTGTGTGTGDGAGEEQGPGLDQG